MNCVHVTPIGSLRNPIGSIAPLDRIIAIGLGCAVVCHNGKQVLDGEHPPRSLERRGGDGWLRFRHAEKKARRDPRGVWEVHIAGPLWSAVWRRERPGKWVCIEAGDGFA